MAPQNRARTALSASALLLNQALTDQWSFALAHNIVDYEQKLIEHRKSGFVDGSDTQIQLQYGDRDGEAEVTSTSAYFTGDFDRRF